MTIIGSVYAGFPNRGYLFEWLGWQLSHFGA